MVVAGVVRLVVTWDVGRLRIGVVVGVVGSVITNLAMVGFVMVGGVVIIMEGVGIVMVYV